jgi:hypothetical protein
MRAAELAHSLHGERTTRHASIDPTWFAATRVSKDSPLRFLVILDTINDHPIIHDFSFVVIGSEAVWDKPVTTAIEVIKIVSTPTITYSLADVFK